MNWDHNQVIGFDVETSGTRPEYALQPWRVATGDAWLTSHVWQYRDHGEWLTRRTLFPNVDDMRSMLEFAIREQRSIVGWNVQFDIQWLIAHGFEDLVFKVFWLDGMLLWKHYDVAPEYDMAAARKRRYGLKDCVAQELPEYAGYEDEVDYHSTDPADLNKLLDYNVLDVTFTLKLARKWYNLLTPRQRQAAIIEAQSIPHVALANLKGLPVDIVTACELRAQLLSDAADAMEKMAHDGASPTIIASPKKLGTLLYDTWGLPVQGATKTGANSTDKAALHELALIDERAQTVRDFREAIGNRTKFAEAPLASALYNGDGCTHPQAFMFGTYSGRMTYGSDQKQRMLNPATGKMKITKLQTGFALHQIKRGPEYRRILHAPLGYMMVEFDAASQEFRWMAIASGDETMLRLCLPGEDAHAFMGAAIAGVDYRELMKAVAAGDKLAKARRQLGKIANLSLQYRTSARKLLMVARVIYGLPMTIEEAQRIYDTYHRTYPGVRRYWARQIDLTQQQGYVETFAGRRVTVMGDWGGQLGWSMQSTAINYRIQGTGADQKYLAIATITPYLRAAKARFTLDLHDGLTFFVPQDLAYGWAEDMSKVLAELDYDQAWGFTPPVPMPFDCKMGFNFGDMEEVKFQ